MSDACARLVVEIDHLMRTHGGVGISESGGHASVGVPVSVVVDASPVVPDDDPPEDDPPDEEPPDDDDVEASAAPVFGVLSSSPHAAVNAVAVSDTPARTTAE